MNINDLFPIIAIVVLIACFAYGEYLSLRNACNDDEKKQGNKCPHASGRHVQNGKLYCNACDTCIGLAD